MNTTKMYQVLTENKAYIREDVYDILLGMVNEELAKEVEKAAGRKPNIRNAVKKFLGDDFRPMLTRASIQEIDGKTYYGYCDGFKLAWSPIDFGLGVNEKHETFNWTGILNNRIKNPGTVTVNKADVIECIKTHDKRNRVITVYHPEGWNCDFNADYLKAAMDFTETEEMYIDLETVNGPVYFHNEKEDRHALVLPIRR